LKYQVWFPKKAAAIFIYLLNINIPSKESIAFSAQLECILDAFLSPPKRFRLTEILHGTSALGGDRFNNRFSKRREEIFFFTKINKNKNPTPQTIQNYLFRL
jgi:hypothetical protein